MTLVELVRRGGVAIALLGDGQRHDAGVGRRQRGEQGFGVLRRHEQARDGPDHPEALARAVAHRERVEPVLRRERVARVRGAERCAEDAPTGGALGQRGVGVGRHVGAVEGADPEVDDAGAERRTVVGGAGDRSRETSERGVGEARHHGREVTGLDRGCGSFERALKD